MEQHSEAYHMETVNSLCRICATHALRKKDKKQRKLNAKCINVYRYDLKDLGFSIDHDGKFIHSSVICCLCESILKNYKKGSVCKETTIRRLSEKWYCSNKVWCPFNGELDINLCPLCKRRTELSEGGRGGRGRRRACGTKGQTSKEAAVDSDTIHKMVLNPFPPLSLSQATSPPLVIHPSPFPHQSGLSHHFQLVGAVA